MSEAEREPGRHIEEPPRLLEQDGAAGQALRQANPAFERGLDEPGAWRALQARRARVRRRRFVLLPLAGLAVGAAALLLVPRLRDQHDVVPIAPQPPAAPPTTAARTEPAPVVRPLPAPQGPARAPRLQPGPARRELPPGRSVLADGSVIRLQPRARADLQRATDLGTRVTLYTGTVEVTVTPQHEHTFEIAAGDAIFSVVGTQFRVSLSERKRPALEVSEGVVAVLQGGRTVARITAGGRWSSPAELAAQPPEPEQPRPAPPDAERCLALARQGRARDAIACLEPIAGGTGLSAEMALYETARLQRDVLGDARGALATLQRHEGRFPTGALHVEVQLSTVDLLARLGRTDDALAESGRLLQGPAGRERAYDLHLLRGNLLRERAGDCVRAEQEFARAAADRGATGAEATLRRAQCLETLGRRQEALDEYRACLQRAQGRIAAEARRGLESLQR